MFLKRTKRHTHFLIFEGAELTGKSFIMSEIYNYLEKKYNKSKDILDGCHWINADVGIFGTRHAKESMNAYIRLFKALRYTNVIVEKFHLADAVYQEMYHLRGPKHSTNLNLKKIESQLLRLGAKIVFLTIDEDKKIIEGRLKDRLNLYPHYKRTAKKAEWYILQQRAYKKIMKQSKIPTLTVDTTTLPNKKVVDEILAWIGEK